MSLDCAFLIALSVFSNVYLLPTVCLVSCVPNIVCVFGLSILIALSVFSNVYLLPTVWLVSCVPNVVCVSGLSIIDCHFRFL